MPEFGLSIVTIPTNDSCKECLFFTPAPVGSLTGRGHIKFGGDGCALVKNAIQVDPEEYRDSTYPSQIGCAPYSGKVCKLVHGVTGEVVDPEQLVMKARMNLI